MTPPKPRQHTKQNAVVPARTDRQMRRIALAGFVGTVIEFYDLTLYAVAASLVFAKVFFPALGPAAGTVAAFGTLGVAFVARPIGALIFGHFGDRLGRKRMLVTTLLLMGGATVVVGAMPTAGQIGVAAPILVVLMRIVQGIAAGGELAGAALFSTESAPAAKRGFWTMFTSLGGGFSIVIANATLLAVGAGLSDAQFASFGWRIPFLASALLIGVGLYIRLKIEESPVFEAGAEAEPSRGAKRPKLPIVEAWRRQPRQMLLVAGISIMQAAFTYLGATYFANVGTAQLGLSRNVVLAAGIAGGLCWSLGVVIGAMTSDRVGRRPVLLAATGAAVVWAVVVFPVLQSASGPGYLALLCATMLIAGLEIGSINVMLSEIFETRHRYTASAFAYNIGLVLGGAVPPLVAGTITASYGAVVFGVFLALLCLISLLSAIGLPETRDRDLLDVLAVRR
ncbi:MHS family MFS transporter [Amycolatopsis rubida]|uniref:MHS family MFS transporter n=1 Tax=Amycolatopsis rubida TaxID=112413 RepID=A0ABX0C027_9PSEU|nr:MULTISPECIES: MFS transporter [Amycolatopsis]MYW96201.1 MFS transporter [Amycolatopsis rubida]NEC61192.1 MHS family MFS transporter [Amycolatopsis rubida]OAP24282.1 Inner membrane metabolite transport protein YhjE [Amycolatopsis sp. M39]